jgi:hypothetical protein
MKSDMRRLTQILFTVCILLTTNSEAQLVNIEKSRKEARPGFQGHIDLNLMLTRNTRQILETGTTAHLQYTSGKHTLLALNNLGFMRVEGENLINNGFQHLRYNYKIGNGFTTAEAFIQHQYNSIRLLQRRFLLGGGPRFRIYENESTGVFIAPLVMYEQELLNDGSPRTDRFKGDLYVSFTWSPDESITFSHTTYYQPDFSLMSEYRISSETGLEMQFTANFSFLITWNLAFDSHPPADIPGLFYTLRNGIKYSF